uniref:Semaphorin 5B n=2 Tax=Echinococcus granulosus TaxID=6210 RepID=A0A068X1V5_ECHGR|nr:semaphorin 5B [Echinococcus granulosus]
MTRRGLCTQAHQQCLLPIDNVRASVHLYLCVRVGAREGSGYSLGARVPAQIACPSGLLLSFLSSSSTPSASSTPEALLPPASQPISIFTIQSVIPSFATTTTSSTCFPSMDYDFETKASTYSHRFPRQLNNSTRKPPIPHRTTSTRSTSLSTTQLSSAGSNLDLLIDHRFSKSSQRRRRYIRPTYSFWILVACWTPLLLLLMSSLAPGVLAASEDETISLSRALDSPSDESAELRTLPKPPPAAAGNLESSNDLADVELSDDLELPANVEDSLQNEDASIFHEQEMHVSLEEMNFQTETMVVDEYSQISKREVHIKDLVASDIARTYSDRMHVEFRSLLYASSENSLYAVAKEATLVKLDGKTLTPIDAYSVPPLPQASVYCQESLGCKQRREINVLAKTPEKPFVFYCSLHYEAYPHGVSRQVLTSCVVPNPTNLAENLLIWDNGYYTSMDPQRPPVILVPKDNTPEQSAVETPHQPFFYVAGVTVNFLHIGRLQMPDWASGSIHWDGALFSPKRNVFINEPATIVMSFETNTAAYFLLREKSSSSSRHPPPRETISRLVRVCRGDRGGLRGIAEHYFGTMAKADLLCQSELAIFSRNGERSRFTFDSAQSAYWDANAKRLYAVFSAGEAGPHGSAACVYDLKSIEKTFRGPITNSNYRQRQASSSAEASVRPNPFPTICERFAAGNLTADELSLGQIGANFLYRYEPVSPLFGHAIAMSPTVTWSAVIGYKLPPIANAHYTTSILWLTSASHLTQLAFYESHNKEDDSPNPVLLSTCELRRLRVSQTNDFLERLRDAPKLVTETQKPSLQQRKSSRWGLPFNEDDSWQSSPDNPPESSKIEHIMSIIREDDSIFLGTTHTIFRFPTDTCFSHSTEEACMTSGDPHCGWNNQIFRCVSLLSLRGPRTSGLNFNMNAKMRPRCPSSDLLRVKNKDSSWSPWRPCLMTSDLHPKTEKTSSVVQRSCLCRICLSEKLCNFGEQQVSQCKVPGVWSPWSSWSRCLDKLRFRTRTCFNPLLGTEVPTSDCLGAEREEQFCLMRPLIPEEVAFEGTRAEHVALKKSTNHGITIDRNHLVGMLVGLSVGVLFTLLFIFLFVRLCRSRRRLTSRSSHSHRLQLQGGRRSISNIQLVSQLRDSLLSDHPTYANPSPIERSIHSTFSPRYNFILHHSPPMSFERASESNFSSTEETSTTTGIYDRLSETNK